MDIKDLILVSRNAHEMLINALTEYVREHGVEMNNYFYNEHGIYDEDEDGVKVVKVLDISTHGCYFACQDIVNDESLENFDYHDADETQRKLSGGFHHYAIWSLYIVRDSDGNETLKYYMFHSDGVEYEEDSEPDHDAVESLTLADLRYIIEAIIENE